MAIRNHKPEPQPVERLYYRPKEAAAAVGISVRKMRELIATGVVRSFLLGSVRLVPVADLKALADDPDTRRR